MPYIRIKKISDNKYAYLAETINTKSGPRQKIKQYLGKVYHLDKREEVDEVDLGNKKENILLSLIITELKARGFKAQKEKEEDYIYQNLTFSTAKFTLTKKTKQKTKKEVLLAVNEGYLCTFTLQQLLNFKKSKDLNKDAYELAKYFLEAGLNISKEKFVEYYKSLR